MSTTKCEYQGCGTTHECSKCDGWDGMPALLIGDVESIAAEIDGRALTAQEAHDVASHLRQVIAYRTPAAALPSSPPAQDRET